MPGFAERVEDRIEILDLGLRRGGFQLLHERGFTRVAPIPPIFSVGVPEPRRIALGLAAEYFGGERRVERPMVGRKTADCHREISVRPRLVHAKRSGGFQTRRQRRTKHAGVPPFVPRLEIHDRLLGASVDDHACPGFGDAGEVEELAVLPEGHLAWRPGRTEHDGHGVADPIHHLRAPRGELLGRENLRAPEHGLCAG
jgi:hypothetical protein